MKRYAVLKTLIGSLNKNDVLIFSGQEICKEAYQYHADNFLYLDEPIDISISVALGMAMNTDKRIYIFLGEGELIRNISSLLQAGVGRCRNLFVIVLDNFGYQTCSGFPTIFDTLSSKLTLAFNLGMTVINFTTYFQRKEYKEMKDTLQHCMGTLFLYVEVEKSLKKDLEIPKYNYSKMSKTITEFILNKDIATALFQPPVELNFLNIDALPVGGMTHGL